MAPPDVTHEGAPDPLAPRVGLTVAVPEVVVSCTHVTRRFHTGVGEVLALDGVSMDVLEGSLSVIAGPSGSGKSTLLGLIGCLDRADEGIVALEGLDLVGLPRKVRRRLRRTRIGIVLPQPSDNLLDRLDASENVAWSANVRGATVSQAEIDAVFARFGLGGAEHRTVRQLSGGEQQRVALAAALAGGPAVVLADEPTASLDRGSAGFVIAALRTAANAGATVIVATHDHDVIEAADDVVHLDHGRRV